jgi:cytoskeletal protein RodZ
MKKFALSILAIFLLTTGAAMAQSANTTAPGPTMQREPGQTNNNLPNPGNPQTDLSNRDTYSAGTTGTTGTTTGTTTTTTTTGTGTGLTGNETEQNEGMDVDVDTGARANGAVDIDVKRHGDNDTDASGIDETGTGPATQTGSATTTDNGALPNTASELPLLGIAGLLALASFFMVRTARRNA